MLEGGFRHFRLEQYLLLTKMRYRSEMLYTPCAPSYRTLHLRGSKKDTNSQPRANPHFKTEKSSMGDAIRIDLGVKRDRLRSTGRSDCDFQAYCMTHYNYYYFFRKVY